MLPTEIAPKPKFSDWYRRGRRVGVTAVTGPPFPAILLNDRGKSAAKPTKHVVRVAHPIRTTPKNAPSSKVPRTASCSTRNPSRPTSSPYGAPHSPDQPARAGPDVPRITHRDLRFRRDAGRGR